MGRRVPHQAVDTALEVLDLRREQATIRRKPRQEHHPWPRRIGRIAYPVDDLSAPCIEVSLSACSLASFASNDTQYRTLQAGETRRTYSPQKRSIAKVAFPIL